MKENIPGYPGYHITKDGKVNKIVSQYKSDIRWDNNLI